MSILVSNVSKHFGQFAALNNVTLEIPEGDLVKRLYYALSPAWKAPMKAVLFLMDWIKPINMLAIVASVLYFSIMRCLGI